MQPAVDVDEFMNSWTLQMGYPVVTISKKGGNKVAISQAKYRFDNDDIVDSPYGYVMSSVFTAKILFHSS